MGEYDRVQANGHTLERRLYVLLEHAGHAAGVDLIGRVVQGSYNQGVSASAGTHDGGGAVDLSIWGLSDDQIWHVLTELRKRGVAAWHRTTAQGFSPHIHGIDSGSTHLQWLAASQITDYKNGRNGLASHAADQGPKIAVTPQTWQQIVEGDNMPLTDKDVDKVAAAVVNRLMHAEIDDPQDKSKKPVTLRRLLARMARRED